MLIIAVVVVSVSFAPAAAVGGNSDNGSDDKWLFDYLKEHPEERERLRKAQEDSKRDDGGIWKYLDYAPDLQKSLTVIVGIVLVVATVKGTYGAVRSVVVYFIRYIPAYVLCRITERTLLGLVYEPERLGSMVSRLVSLLRPLIDRR